VLDHPVVILVEESEYLPEVLGLLLQELVEDIEFSPLDLLVVVKVVGLEKDLLDFLLVEVFKVLGVGCLFDIASTFLYHTED